MRNLKFVYTVYLVMVLLVLTGSCQVRQSIDVFSRTKDLEKLEARKKLAHNRSEALFGVLNEDLTVDEKGALQFLYAYMPLNDLADYEGSFFLEQVKVALKAKREMSWGKELTGSIFSNFVLPYRVNNENLDSFRLIYYEELKHRVAGMSLKEAALEVNHWCHEKVSYHGADIRTSSPMNTMKSGRGRCGEESTLTVMALRTVAIPARQVYTPRWAHSDDNHAWVEVWTGDGWHFMGGCEPAPDFDMGWFKEPARRAMLVHTKAFGRYEGKEPLVKETENYAEINSLARYATVKPLVVHVTDDGGNPVQLAEVSFGLFNYAEFYPLATLLTGPEGTTSFTTGMGDLRIWASKNGQVAFDKVSVEDKDTVNLTLGSPPLPGSHLNWDLHPPVTKNALPVSEKGVKENDLRLKEEDSIRISYLNTFMDSARAAELARSVNLDPARFWKVIQMSEGNYKELKKYFKTLPDDKKAFAIDLLKGVSWKDLRDVPATVFLDHLVNTFNTAGSLPEENREMFVKYVLAPRVANELLVDYRKFLQDGFQKEFGDKRIWPEDLINWINTSIVFNTKDNYYQVPLTPKGVFKLKVSDSYSRKIFFVTACRSLGIPARLDEAFQVPQFFDTESMKWKDVFFKGDAQLSEKSARLHLKNASDGKISEYHIHFTIGYLSNGNYQTLEYGYGTRMTHLPNPLPLPGGSYVLITGNRLNDGSVLSGLDFFDLHPGESKTLPIRLREKQLRPENFGVLNMNLEVRQLKGDQLFKLNEIASVGDMVLTWVDPDKEPTKHIMNDIPLLRESFNKWGGKMIFLIPEEKMTSSFNQDTYKNLPANTSFYIDPESKMLRTVSSILKIDAGNHLPLIIIVSTEGIIKYHSEGYRIGIGEHLLKVL